MKTLTYSPTTERLVAMYLDTLATKELGGAYIPAAWNDIAHKIVRQLMLDNDEVTTYTATKAEIKAELES